MHAAARLARLFAGEGIGTWNARSLCTAAKHRPIKAASAWLAGGAAVLGSSAVLFLQSSPEERAWVMEEMLAAEPKEPDLWDKWSKVTSFLTSWRRGAGAGNGAGGGTPLPVDKLKCHMPPGGYDPSSYRPVVLVSCGSFNPPTNMHLRMMELAQQAMMQAGYDVLGGYLSPVNDAYWKRALAPGWHRVKMCQLATANSDSLMVDPWEVEQRQYTRTLHVLQHVDSELRRIFGVEGPPKAAGAAAGAAPETCPGTPPARVVLVCGADVVSSMADPAVWRQDLLEELLSRHGVVCITRNGSNLEALLQRPGSLLHTYRGNITIVREPVLNEISSSKVRHELEQGHTVKYLLPDAVLQYVYQHRLYGTAGTAASIAAGAAHATKAPLLRIGEQKVDTDTER